VRHAASIAIPISLISSYYVIWIGLLVVILSKYPALDTFFPVGGLSDMAGTSSLDFESVSTGDMRLAWTAIGPLKLICACIGAVVLIVPVTWVYFITIRARDVSQSFVQTIIIMPVVVTGISMIVMNSIALAFSLAGIVAAVRFRFSLNEPAHAMYIFTAIGVGLGAGIGALDISAVISAAFVYASLVIWKLEYGKTLSGRFLSVLSRRQKEDDDY